MKQERGFALLLIFALAAAVALLLYKELPRVAFEARRDKEQLLIRRGEAYQRAIQLFVRKFKKYPAKIEDLEETNQIRFLRKRYIDPMTGKSEWRLIHVGPGGIFTDSLTHKPPSPDAPAEKKEKNTFTWEAPPIGSNPQQDQNDSALPPARPSDRAALPGQTPLQPGQPGQSYDPSNPQQQQFGYPPVGIIPGAANSNQPGGAYNPYQQQPYQQQPGQNSANFNPNNNGNPPGGAPGQAYGQQQGTYPGSVVNSQNGGVSPSFPYSTAPGAQGASAPFPQPGTTTNPAMQGQNQAMSLINQILTTPHSGPTAAAGAGGLQIAGGIAGVASTLEKTGIKIYNDKKKYNEWEFIYDLTKDTSGMTTTSGIAGAPGSQQTGTAQAAAQSAFGQSAFGQSTPGQSAFGAGSGFGAQPAAGAQAGGNQQTAPAPQQTQQPQLSPQQLYQQQYLQQQQQQYQQQQQQQQAAPPAAPTQPPP